ncbi:competence protein ComJ [Pantoea agglomerans]|uniref:competence protein ComJ n=1 Tax=Enterobacter agglomerans TaxID=549 RepID=UPI00301E1BCF
MPDKQIVDLLISHHQITIFNPDYDPALCQWGDTNIEQGAIIHDSSVTVDSLLDNAYGANVHLIYVDSFQLSLQAKRCIKMPFNISDPDNLFICSVAEEFKIELKLYKGNYDLYFEACEGDEVFYIFTFVKSNSSNNPEFIIADPWGGDPAIKVVIGQV